MILSLLFSEPIKIKIVSLCFEKQDNVTEKPQEALNSKSSCACGGKGVVLMLGEFGENLSRLATVET